MVHVVKSAAMLPSHAASAAACRSALCPAAACQCAARNLQASRAKATMEEACTCLELDTVPKPAPLCRPAGGYQQQLSEQWPVGCSCNYACGLLQHLSTVSACDHVPQQLTQVSHGLPCLAAERRPAYHLAPRSGWINGTCCCSTLLFQDRCTTRTPYCRQRHMLADSYCTFKRF